MRVTLRAILRGARSSRHVRLIGFPLIRRGRLIFVVVATANIPWLFPHSLREILIGNIKGSLLDADYSMRRSTSHADPQGALRNRPFGASEHLALSPISARRRKRSLGPGRGADASDLYPKEMDPVALQRFENWN